VAILVVVKDPPVATVTFPVTVNARLAALSNLSVPLTVIEATVTVAAFTVTVLPFAITTSFAAVGTTPPDHVAVEFQLPFPVEVIVCANDRVDNDSRTKRIDGNNFFIYTSFV
jgi:hypothetical protein